MTRTDALGLVLLLLPACSTHRLFAPRENQNGWSPGGAPAAVYALQDPGRGEVRLWARGAFREARDDTETTRLYVGFELENTGSEPLRLVPEELVVTNVQLAREDGERAGAGVPPELSPASVGGDAAAPPGGSAHVDLQFDFGPDVMPRAILGFTVRWVVTAGDARFEQMTPFAPMVYDDPYWPYSADPWYGGWYGVGFGWHYHCH